MNSIELDFNEAQYKFLDKYGTNDILVALRGMIEYVGYVRSHNNELYDDVFLKLAMRYNNILDENNHSLRRIKINLPSIFSIYEQEVILEMSYEDEIWTEEVTIGQGSAFICEKNNFITNYHVVDNLIKIFNDNKDCINPDVTITFYVFDHYNNKVKLNLKIKELDKKIDYIIFEILNNEILKKYKSLNKSNEVIKIDKREFTLYGFPQYREGNNITASAAQIISLGVKQIKDDPMFIAINAQILEGNSGGPLINNKNQVEGIAVKGTNRTSVTQNQMNPISYLENL
ncbi:S1 family peptidase [Macrococcoides bohemicum]|uniref:S1 family peptidase n=1 Tax=Macrococcoides bohemicum TaxID=1903056 RepID=UPI00193F6A80|nr:serine protease [Macrococcus bohemicus]QRN49118.1 trypsin-like peptidase domain-containing protein [Macrococcus bohemicus]